MYQTPQPARLGIRRHNLARGVLHMRTAAHQMRDTPPTGDRSWRTRSARVRDLRRGRAQQGGKAAQGCRSMTATKGCARLRRINQRDLQRRRSRAATTLHRCCDQRTLAERTSSSTRRSCTAVHRLRQIDASRRARPNHAPPLRAELAMTEPKKATERGLKLHRVHAANTNKKMLGCEEKTCDSLRQTLSYGWAEA